MKIKSTITFSLLSLYAAELNLVSDTTKDVVDTLSKVIGANVSKDKVTNTKQAVNKDEKSDDKASISHFKKGHEDDFDSYSSDDDYGHKKIIYRRRRKGSKYRKDYDYGFDNYDGYGDDDYFDDKDYYDNDHWDHHGSYKPRNDDHFDYGESDGYRGKTYISSYLGYGPKGYEADIHGYGPKGYRGDIHGYGPKGYFDAGYGSKDYGGKGYGVKVGYKSGYGDKDGYSGQVYRRSDHHGYYSAHMPRYYGHGPEYFESHQWAPNYHY